MTTRRRKKHRPEVIVAKLRDAEAMLNAGKDLASVFQALEISEATLDRWRAVHRREAVFMAGIKFVYESISGFRDGVDQKNQHVWPWLQHAAPKHSDMARYGKSNPGSAVYRVGIL